MLSRNVGVWKANALGSTKEVDCKRVWDARRVPLDGETDHWANVHRDRENWRGSPVKILLMVTAVIRDEKEVHVPLLSVAGLSTPERAGGVNATRSVGIRCLR